MAKLGVGDQMIVVYPQHESWIGYCATVKYARGNVITVERDGTSMFWLRQRIRKMHLCFPQDDYFVYGQAEVIPDLKKVPHLKDYSDD